MNNGAVSPMLRILFLRGIGRIVSEIVADVKFLGSFRGTGPGVFNFKKLLDWMSF